MPSYDPNISETQVRTLKVVDPTNTGPYLDLSTSEIVAKSVGSLQVPFAVDTVSGSTANKQEWRSDGTPVLAVGSDGSLLIPLNEDLLIKTGPTTRIAINHNPFSVVLMNASGAAPVFETNSDVAAGPTSYDGLALVSDSNPQLLFSNAAGTDQAFVWKSTAVLNFGVNAGDVMTYDANGRLTVPGDLGIHGIAWVWPSTDSAGALVSDGLGTLSIGAFSLTPGDLSSVGGASGRVTYYTAADGIAGNANLTWDGTDLHSTGFIGPLAGAVTGNVTGNLTGDVTGNVTGDLTGAVDASSLAGISGKFQTGATDGGNANPTVDILGNTLQTANLQNWRGTNGTSIVASMDIAGILTLAGLIATALPTTSGAAGTIYADPTTHALFVSV